MITAKYILQATEDYYKGKNIGGDYTIIYENPTISDKKEIFNSLNKNNTSKRLRAIADAQKQKVWVWDAYNAHHGHMRPELGYSIDTMSDYHIIDLYALYQGPTKLIIESWEDFEFTWIAIPKGTGKWVDTTRFLNSVFALKWIWLEKYITGSSKFMEDAKKQFVDKLGKQ